MSADAPRDVLTEGLCADVSQESRTDRPCADTPLERLADGLPADEPECDSVLYWLWLADVLGPACAHAGHILDHYGDAREVYLQRQDTAAFARVAGVAAAKRLAEHRRPAAGYAALADACTALGVHILTFEDPDYPLALSRISDPPLVLYCTGDAQYLNAGPMVGMVGSRRPTRYGADAAAYLGTQLACGGARIVSGLADGLDSECHRAAVSADMPTIGVMGVPIDRTYPAANAGLRAKIEARGAVISEYPPGYASPQRVTFLQRNRIIAALSDALVVLEARERSGTMSTVSHAERYGKPIFALPGSIFSPLSEGTNLLLAEGRAHAVCSAGAVLECIGLRTPGTPGPKAAPPPPLPENARRVLACIGAKPMSISALAEAAGLPMGALLSALMTLEVAGRVTKQPGGSYILK